MTRIRSLLPITLALVACTACDDVDEPSPGLTPSDPDQPLYVVASRVRSPEGGSTLIRAISSLQAGQVDLSAGLEVPGFGAAHGSLALPGAVFVANVEAPEITRYAIANDGSFQREGVVSFGNFLSGQAPRTIVFASATKAYAISVETYQIFVWNPSDLTITNVLDLGALERDGFAPMWVFNATIQGDQLFIPVSWARLGGDPGSTPDSAVVIVDTRSDELQISAEGRCGGLRAMFKSQANDFYFASSAGAPATWNRLYGERGGSSPCLVRWRAGQSAADADFLLLPSTLAPGHVPVDFSPAGPAHLIFQALDESLVAITPQVTPEQLWGSPAWRFWQVPIAVLETPVEGAGVAQPMALPASALNALRFEVDGRNFIPQVQGDYSTTVLIDVTDPLATTEGPSVVGSVGNLFRVR
jgi:hypothetical protein